MLTQIGELTEAKQLVTRSRLMTDDKVRHYMLELTDY